MIGSYYRVEWETSGALYRWLWVVLTCEGSTLLKWSFISLQKRLMFSVLYHLTFTFLNGCLENKDPPPPTPARMTLNFID